MRDIYWLFHVLQPAFQRLGSAITGFWIFGYSATEEVLFNARTLLTNDLHKKAKGLSLIAFTSLGVGPRFLFIIRIRDQP